MGKKRRGSFTASLHTLKAFPSYLVLIGTTCLLMVLLSPPSVQADETFHPQGTILRKLERGFGNFLCGGLEFIFHLREPNREQLTVPWVEGIGTACYYMIRRTAVGLYEIVTFPVPIPQDYRPVIEPEFVWDYPPRKKKK